MKLSVAPLARRRSRHRFAHTWAPSSASCLHTQELCRYLKGTHISTSCLWAGASSRPSEIIVLTLRLHISARIALESLWAPTHTPPMLSYSLVPPFPPPPYSLVLSAHSVHACAVSYSPMLLCASSYSLTLSHAPHSLTLQWGGGSNSNLRSASTRAIFRWVEHK